MQQRTISLLFLAVASNVHTTPVATLRPFDRVISSTCGSRARVTLKISTTPSLVGICLLDDNVVVFTS